MKTYTAIFYTDGDYAEHQIKARSPATALKAARRIEEDGCFALDFACYDGGQPVNHIRILDDDENEVACWQDGDLRLRLAAEDLLAAFENQTTAAQAVIDHWSEGDLAAAVRSLDASLEPARAAIAKAKPPTA